MRGLTVQQRWLGWPLIVGGVVSMVIALFVDQRLGMGLAALGGIAIVFGVMTLRQPKPGHSENGSGAPR